MNDPQSLLTRLIEYLNSSGVAVETGIAVNLQQLFRVAKISSAEDLHRQRFLLGSAVAKSEKQQKDFYSLLDHFIALEAESPASVSPNKKTGARINRNAIFLALSICAIPVLVLLAFVFYPRTSSIRESPGKSDTIKSDVPVIHGADSCALNPGLILPSKPYAQIPLTFTVTADNTLCIDHCIWSFGDNSKTRTTALDTIVHTYADTGNYKITLVAFNWQGEQNSVVADLHVTGKDSLFHIPLYGDLIPLRQTGLPPETKPHHDLAILLSGILSLLLLLPLFFTLIRFNFKKGRLEPIFHEKYRGSESLTAPYSYSSAQENKNIAPENTIDDLAHLLKRSEYTGRMEFDIPLTLRHTSHKAGFPDIVFSETTNKPDYLVLIDLDSGQSQQAILFEELLNRLEKRQMRFERFWFRGSMHTCYNKTWPKGISIDRLAERFGALRLIIYGKGYSLLNDSTSNGFVSWAPKVLSHWKHKAIVTSVHRSNWGEEERQLLELLPLYPANLRGQLLMAQVFHSGRTQLYREDRSKDIPVAFYDDVRLYKACFNENIHLLTWLYALSVPEKVDWNSTLLVGKIVEQHCSPGERLITYENLLLLTSVEWLQTGSLSPAHRDELLKALNELENGATIIRAIRTELLRVLREDTTVNEKSAAAHEKRIHETLLAYQLANKKQKEDLFMELEYLKQNGFISNFEGELENRKNRFGPFKLLNGLGRAAALAALPIFIVLSLSRNWITAQLPDVWVDKDTVTIDSLTYYNNLAVEGMLRAEQEGKPYDSKTSFCLSKMLAYLHSSNLNGQNRHDTAAYNFMYANYRVGLSYYQQKNWRKAIYYIEFASYFDTMVYPENSITRYMQYMSNHAEAVSSYYLSKDSSDTYRASMYLNRAKFFNQYLISRNFYETYPDKVNNLYTLLSGHRVPTPLPPGGQQLAKKFSLSISAADESGQLLKDPVIVVKDWNGNLFYPSRDSLAQGWYYISISYQGNLPAGAWAERIRDTTFFLSENTQLKILCRKKTCSLTVYFADTLSRPVNGRAAFDSAFVKVTSPNREGTSFSSLNTIMPAYYGGRFALPADGYYHISLVGSKKLTCEADIYLDKDMVQEITCTEKIGFTLPPVIRKNKDSLYSDSLEKENTRKAARLDSLKKWEQFDSLMVKYNQFVRYKDKKNRHLIALEIDSLFPEKINVYEHSELGMTITRVIVINGDEIGDYVRKSYGWGTYYFKNGVQISESTFNFETHNKAPR